MASVNSLYFNGVFNDSSHEQSTIDGVFSDSSKLLFVTQIRRYNQNKHNYFQNFNWLEFCVYLLCIIMRISCSINNYAV